MSDDGRAFRFVRLTEDRVGIYVSGKAGDVLELPEGVAELVIDQGQAEPYEEVHSRYSQPSLF